MSDNSDEIKIDKTFVQALGMIERLGKIFRSESSFLQGIQDIGGKTAYSNEVYNYLVQLENSIKDAHFDALHHKNNEGDYNLRRPLPKLSEKIETKEDVPEIRVENTNQQSYSQLRAEAKEL